MRLLQAPRSISLPCVRRRVRLANSLALGMPQARSAIFFAITRLCENLERWRTMTLSDEPDHNVTCSHWEPLANSSHRLYSGIRCAVDGQQRGPRISAESGRP